MDYKIIDNLLPINEDAIDLIVKVNENFFDPIILRKEVWKLLNQYNAARVNLDSNVANQDLLEYDNIIVATYSNINSQLNKLEFARLKKYQFELLKTY